VDWVIYILVYYNDTNARSSQITIDGVLCKTDQRCTEGKDFSNLAKVGVADEMCNITTDISNSRDTEHSTGVQPLSPCPLTTTETNKGMATHLGKF